MKLPSAVQSLKIFGLTVTLAALLSACGAFSTPPAPKTPLLIEYTQWWGDYTLIIAQEKGIFAKYNVNVQPVYYDVFSRSLPDMAAGQIDGGLFSIGDAINVSRYTNIKVVAVYDNGGLNTIVSTPSLTNPADLAGKRVGVPIGSTYELMIQEVLKSANLRTSDIKLVNTNPEDVPAALGNTIDAGFVYEPYTSQAVAQGNQLLIKSDQFVGLYPDVIVFRETIVKERGDEIRAFLKAWFEAVEYRENHVQESLQIIAEHEKISVEELASGDQMALLTLADNVEIFQSQSQKYRPLEQTARLNADFLLRLGVLSTLPDLNTLLDASFFTQ